MAKNMALTVLRDLFHCQLEMTLQLFYNQLATNKVSQMGPNAHIGRGTLLEPPAFHGEALEEDESLPVVNVILDILEIARELRQSE